MEWKLYFVQGMQLLFLGIGAYYDMKDQKIPLCFLIIFLGIGSYCNLFLRYQSFVSIFGGFIIGSLFLAFGWLTQEKIGYGDGIALIVLGIFGGGKNLLAVLFLAFFLSGIYGIWLLVRAKVPGTKEIPFFPFLFLGMMGVIFL